MRKQDLSHYRIAHGLGIDADSVPNFIVASSYEDDDTDPATRRSTLIYAGDSDSAAYAAHRLALAESYQNVLLSARG